jgi:hypothetical protein
MRSAYNALWLYHLQVIKETKRWLNHGLITPQQYQAIAASHQSGFYHPNFIIRILLFIATILALSGVTGLLALMIGGGEEATISILSIIYGIICFGVVDQVFIANHRHYKSGVTEAIIYHSAFFVIFGFSLATENVRAGFSISLIVFAFSAWRYLDLLSTVAFIATLCCFVANECHEAGGSVLQLLPFFIIGIFTPLYFIARALGKKNRERTNNFLVIEFFSLLLIYAAGNYFVVREVSSAMGIFTIEENADIPFALLFYALTILIPIIYLYFGIRLKDIVLLRVSLVVIAFSVFTFKYYYGFGHPEITLTLAGIVVTAIALLLMNYLKTIRHGFTRENLLEEKWGNSNLQAFIVSQTTGGNEVTTSESFQGGGGEFGGGGASGEF